MDKEFQYGNIEELNEYIIKFAKKKKQYIIQIFINFNKNTCIFCTL